jgi:hypothetical protein
MKDALASVVHTNLDLHFGRLDTLTAGPDDHPALAGAASSLVRRISENLLHAAGAMEADTTVQRHVFGRDAALPPWLVNKGLVACQNDRAGLEPAVCGILENAFHRRRFLDYLSGELLYHSFLWSSEDEKARWPVRMASDLRENQYCLELNTQGHVLKFDDSIIGKKNVPEDVHRWFVKSLGTVTLVDFTTRPIYEFTARLVEAKYKTPFVLTLFKDLFAATSQGPVPDRFGVLVLGDIPKFFALSDYVASLQASQAAGISREAGVLDLLRHVLGRFDNQSARRYPEARFRLGGDPPQGLVNRVGAMVWLRRTLQAAKAVQKKKAAPSRGLRVEELTVLAEALKQKSILYFSLFDDPDSSAINPCSLKDVGKEAMVLQSPRGNRLNDAKPGQEVHGYFAITGHKQKSTYCDFRSNVVSVTPVDANHALVELALPAAFELTRRSHKRLPLDPSHLAVFEMAAPAMGVDWSVFSALDKWPAPFCIIPDGASHCHIKDLSAGGLMLDLHRDAPAYEYFTQRSAGYPLLALMHLVGRSNIPDLKLGLRLEVKRIRDFPPLCKKYVGVQFVEAGEIRQDKFVRFTPVGKDGIFLINDWIFRNSIGR